MAEINKRNAEVSEIFSTPEISLRISEEQKIRVLL